MPIKTYLILIISIFLCSYSFKELKNQDDLSKIINKDAPLYLPKENALKAISFSYNNALAHTLWFNTVSYFGKHYKSDKNYEWLYQMCRLTYKTNNSMEHVYEFCALMLSWEANKPKLADTILSDFIIAYPNKWRPLYLRAMNTIIFEHVGNKAKEYLIKTTEIENSPPFLARLLSMKLAELEGEDTAIKFLKSMLSKSSDPNQQKSLKTKLEKLIKQKNNKKLKKEEIN